MKKILPIFLIVLLSTIFVTSVKIAYAQGAGGGQQIGEVSDLPADQFQEDKEVTVVGKSATRSSDFLTWTIQN
jgi:hypothetical protein